EPPEEAEHERESGADDDAPPADDESDEEADDPDREPDGPQARRGNVRLVVVRAHARDPAPFNRSVVRCVKDVPCVANRAGPGDSYHPPPPCERGARTRPSAGRRAPAPPRSCGSARARGGRP